MGELNLTEEQIEFLTLCEEEFKDRYTDDDEDFMKIKSEEPKNPPIVDPWYNKPRNKYDWSRQNREQGDRGGRRNYSDRRNDRNDRYEKHAGKHYIQQRNSRPY